MKIFLVIALILLGPVVLDPVIAGAPDPRSAPVHVTVNGRTWTQQELFQRNIGGRDEQTTAFPPHKVIGNTYDVGTRSLSAYLITTPQGHILVNSTYERNVPIGLAQGGPNPFIDPAGYKAELDLDEAMFHAVLAAQQKENQ